RCCISDLLRDGTARGARDTVARLRGDARAQRPARRQPGTRARSHHRARLGPGGLGASGARLCVVPVCERLADRRDARATDRRFQACGARVARPAGARARMDRAALLARPTARPRAGRSERRQTRAGAGGARMVGGAGARSTRAAVSDAFKALEVAGWREPGRGDAYDAVVGRVTARVAEPLLDAVGVLAGTSLLDVATGTGHVAGAAAARGARAAGVDVSAEMLARARRP